MHRGSRFLWVEMEKLFKILIGYNRRERRGTDSTMKALCDIDIWVWHFQFGFPGRNNDLNILDLSYHFINVLSGAFQPVKPAYKISGELFNSYYYLADGIYPSWKYFEKALHIPVSEVQSSY